MTYRALHDCEPERTTTNLLTLQNACSPYLTANVSLLVVATDAVPAGSVQRVKKTCEDVNGGSFKQCVETHPARHKVCTWPLLIIWYGQLKVWFRRVQNIPGSNRRFWTLGAKETRRAPVTGGLRTTSAPSIGLPAAYGMASGDGWAICTLRSCCVTF